MKKHNCHIGFSDAWLMLVGIPLLSFIIPFVFFNCSFSRAPFFNLSKFAGTLLVTTTIWMGNRYIMIYSRKKFPEFEQVRQRLFWQSAYMLVFTVITNFTLGYFLEPLFMEQDQLPIGLADRLLHSNAASLFCTTLIIAIYESIFFMHQLRHSIEEKETLKRESLNAQLDALRTQVNPHFLFNNLNTLVSLIPENPKQATDFVHQLSKLYRHVLEFKNEASIELREELAVLHAYAFLLKTRFGKNLEVTIDVPEERMHTHIVPLSLQLLMENAIKHNIVSADKPLRIHIYAQNGSLVVDNNLQMKKQRHDSTGIGLENIRNRYRLISQKPVEVTETDAHFRVSIPLIEPA